MNGSLARLSPRRPVVTAEAATSPFPKASPRRIHRAVSSTTLLEAIRQLGREHPLELAPLLGRQRRQRACRSLPCAVALVVITGVLLLATLRWAVEHEVASRVTAFGDSRAAQPPEHRAPHRSKPAGPGEPRAALALLGVCGAIAGLCLFRWPGARLQLQRLMAALVEAFGSAGAASTVQTQQAGRLAGPLGHALRIARALLPSSAVEWLLIAFNVVLFTRLWIFTRSGAFVAVCASPRAKTLPGGRLCSRALTLFFLRPQTIFCASSGCRLDPDAGVAHRIS